MLVFLSNASALISKPRNYPYSCFQDQNSDRTSISSLGALDSESMSLTDEEVIHDFDGTSSPQENNSSVLRGVGQSFESSASHSGSSSKRWGKMAFWELSPICGSAFLTFLTNSHGRRTSFNRWLFPSAFQIHLAHTLADNSGKSCVSTV